MPGFPMTTVGGVAVSRVIIGTNSFLGYSHMSQARDRWLREYFWRSSPGVASMPSWARRVTRYDRP